MQDFSSLCLGFPNCKWEGSQEQHYLPHRAAGRVKEGMRVQCFEQSLPMFVKIATLRVIRRVLSDGQAPSPQPAVRCEHQRSKEQHECKILDRQTQVSNPAGGDLLIGIEKGSISAVCSLRLGQLR